MVHSMTGFASENFVFRETNYNLELKTLNSKGWEFNFKSPVFFRNLEIQIKGILQKKLERGKIELSIQTKDTKKGFVAIDEQIFSQQYEYLKKLATHVGSSAEVFSLVVQNYHNIVEIEDLSSDEVNEFVLLIGNLCQKLEEYRIIEGTVIKNDLLDWVDKIEVAMQTISKISDKRIDIRREKLLQGIREIANSTEIDYNRLGQEIIYYIEKLDISEELSRLQQHIQLFLKTLHSNEHSGKKLGFVAQEMGREINTIGAKANDSEIQHIVVNMKDLLERVKEQLNNVV